jgi:hypothetical protein
MLARTLRKMTYQRKKGIPLHGPRIAHVVNHLKVCLELSVAVVVYL